MSSSSVLLQQVFLKKPNRLVWLDFNSKHILIDSAVNCDKHKAEIAATVIFTDAQRVMDIF